MTEHQVLKASIGAPSITWKRSEGGRFKLSRDALECIREYVQDEPDKSEAGGVLLGRYIRGTSDVVVDSVTQPSSSDRRERFRFFRARKPHQEQVDAAWATSYGTRVYLGEWHTHPVPEPVPSQIDLFDWRRKLFVDRFDRYLFFLIAGTSEVGIWEGRRYRLGVRALRLQ